MECDVYTFVPFTLAPTFMQARSSNFFSQTLVDIKQFKILALTEAMRGIQTYF